MNLKTLGLLALSVTALMAFAASAHATTVTSPTGTAATGEEEQSAGEGHIVMDNPIAAIGCASNFTGRYVSHGEGVTAKGNVTGLTFTNCTNSWHVTVVSGGTLEAHHIGSYNATVTSTGVTVEATRFGITCRYSTNNTDFGTVTGGNPATLDITAAIPFHSGSGLCGSGATTVTGSYQMNGSAYYDA